MDPHGDVTLLISNETPEAGITGPSPGETVPFQCADREAEDSRRLLLVEKGVHVCSAADRVRRQS
jgi:hypothetical protein